MIETVTVEMTNLPADLTMPQLWAFLHKTYGGEALQQFLREVIDLNRYGDVLSLERQQETLKELRTIATTVEAVLPHEWELPHPYSDRIWDDGREQLILKWQKEMDAKRTAFEEQNSPQVLGNTPA